MNKLLGLFLLALAFLAPAGANAATCFWFSSAPGGNINDTTKWFAASGGTGGACAAAGGWPNSTSDNGTFDANSGGGTITRNVNWTIGILNIGAFTGTFGNSGDTATVDLITFTNNGAGVRTTNMGASTWTCGISSNSCSWFVGGTNHTFNADTSTVVWGGGTSASQNNIQAGSLTYNVVTFSQIATNARGSIVNGAATYGTLNIASPNYIIFTQSQISTITTLNFTGGTPSITSIVSLLSANGNQAFTFNIANAASCSYCTIRDMTVTGAGSLTATNSLNLGNNTNVSITPPTIGGGGGGRIIGG